MTNDVGQANANGTYWIYEYVSLTSAPGNSGGPLWYQGWNGPYVVGIASTGLGAADITLTFSQLQAWVSGDDSLFTTSGGTGWVNGTGGDDLLFGHQGYDMILAGEGNNTVVGGTDLNDWADSIIAGGGHDFIISNGGNDTIAGGNGNNSLVGGFGVDSIVSGAGNDIIWGNQNDDIILAGDGADLIFGGMGNDQVQAGGGNDTIYGNESNDLLTGGGGADRYVFATGSGVDQVNGFVFAEGDRLDVQSQTFTLGAAGDGDACCSSRAAARSSSTASRLQGSHRRSFCDPEPVALRLQSLQRLGGSNGAPRNPEPGELPARPPPQRHKFDLQNSGGMRARPDAMATGKKLSEFWSRLARKPLAMSGWRRRWFPSSNTPGKTNSTSRRRPRSSRRGCSPAPTR